MVLQNKSMLPRSTTSTSDMLMIERTNTMVDHAWRAMRVVHSGMMSHVWHAGIRVRLVLNMGVRGSKAASFTSDLAIMRLTRI